MHYLTIVLAFSMASGAFSLKYTDCGSKTGKVTDVYLSGCEDTDVCELKRGESYAYGLSFESLTDSKSLKAVAHGIIGGISMPYPLPNSDACEHGNIECPLQSGNSYLYGNDIEVSKSYPAVRVDVKWQLKDESNDDVACVLIPVKIV